MTTAIWRKRKKQQLAYGAARRAAWVAQGLRCDGKPRAPLKPCGCHHGSCLKCARTTNALITKPALIARMYADYQAGDSFGALSKKYSRNRKSISQIFKRRGLQVREVRTKPRLGWGVRIPFPGKAELNALIEGLPQLQVPAEIKLHWRKWSLAKRRVFIKLCLRKKFPSKRPKGKFSGNVQPFEYGTPPAHAIAARMNRGRNSQTKVVNIKPCSEGVIYCGELFFWEQDTYVRGTGWKRGRHRPVLKQIIYLEHIGTIPSSMTVFQKDGNKNNFSPSNLALRSRADCMRLNTLHRKSLSQRQLIWDRSSKSKRATSHQRSRAQASILLQSFQQPQQRPVMAALLRNKL